jgi:sugar lactone lactonase YvrE
MLFGAVLMLVTATAQADGMLYFADIFYPDWSDGYIYTVDTDGSGLQTVVDVGGGLRGLAVDPSGGKLYWTDVDNDVIRRANLDGTDPEDLVTTGLAWPMGIAVHPAADMLDWGDQTLDQIGTAHLDGSGAGPLLPTSFHSGIAFDTINDKIYWSTSITAAAGEILRAELDGSNVDTIVTGVDKPARIALDIPGGKVYWTDYTIDVVRRANLDGSSVQDLYVVGENLNPDGIALDLGAGKVYWAQSYTTNREKIMRMNLDGTDPEDVIIGNFGIIADISFVSSPSNVVDVRLACAAFSGNWPNPFGSQTTIGFTLTGNHLVRLTLYAIDGRRIATLIHDHVPAGRHEVLWNGSDDRGHRVSNGTYYCRIAAGEFSGTTRIVLSR